MLPTALQVNRQVADQSLCELAVACGIGRAGEPMEMVVDQFITKVQLIGRKIGIPDRLSELGVEKSQLPQLVTSSRGNSMSGNPCDLSDAELLNLLEDML